MHHDERYIRVFVSSTFRDMFQEREHLVKRVFPQLAELCRERDVTWAEVDLRWGITDEERAEGQVLPICLAEVEECRPYFIGLLGERYGWIPEQTPASLDESEPWLRKCSGCSVTELEILHGVLNRPDMAEHAFFYFRNPEYIKTLPLQLQPEYRECPPPEDVARLGEVKAQQRAEDRARKLSHLKERIRRSGLPVREGFLSPQQLGDWVLADLTAVIEKRFPIEQGRDPVNRERAAHRSFAERHTRVFIGREDLFSRLDAHISSNAPPLVLTGEPGCGKSALLANWVLPRITKDPKEVVIFRFVGATSESSGWKTLVSSVLREYHRRCGIEEEIPLESEALRSMFLELLETLAGRSPLILVLDGLDQLLDEEGTRNLAWLPLSPPEKVRLIVSTRTGRTLDELAGRNWRVLSVDALGSADRKRLVNQYFAYYRKTLDPRNVERIVRSPATGNPLFLRALLEELRVFGRHEELDRYLKEYLKSKNPYELLTAILSRWEEDYNEGRPLVGYALAFIRASRRGLAEREIRELLGGAEGPLPQGLWSPFFVAAREHFFQRAGIISIAHEYLERIIQKRYIASEEVARSLHRHLAEYFGKDPCSPRGIEELPWQLARACAWSDLFELLQNREFFVASIGTTLHDLQRYWALIESKTESRMTKAYQPFIDAPWFLKPSTAFQLAQLLSNTGHIEEALSIYKDMAAYYRQTGDRVTIRYPLLGMGALLNHLGRNNQAVEVLRQGESIARAWGDQDLLVDFLYRRSIILQERGEWPAAMELLDEAERICRKLGQEKKRAQLIASRAVVFQTQGQLDQAEHHYRILERLLRAMDDKAALVPCLNGLGGVLFDKRDLGAAQALFEEAETLSRGLGNRKGIADSLNNLGRLSHLRRDFDKALAQFKESEHLHRVVGDPLGALVALGNQAAVLKDQGEGSEALRVFQSQEKAYRQLGYKLGLVKCLNNQVAILYARGDREKSLSLSQEQARLSRELGDKDGLAAALHNQAMVLEYLEDVSGAWSCYAEEEQCRRELGQKRLLERCLCAKTNLCILGSQFANAIPMIREREKLCREGGDAEALAECLGDAVKVFSACRRIEEALAACEEQAVLSRRIKDPDGLARALFNQATLLLARNPREGARALPLADEALRIAMAHGLGDLVSELRNGIQTIRRAIGYPPS